MLLWPICSNWVPHPLLQISSWFFFLLELFCNFHLIRPGKNRLFYAQNFRHQGTYCRKWCVCIRISSSSLPVEEFYPSTLLISSISMMTQPAQMVASILIAETKKQKKHRKRLPLTCYIMHFLHQWWPLSVTALSYTLCYLEGGCSGSWI